jgi:hypothetical protein
MKSLPASCGPGPCPCRPKIVLSVRQFISEGERENDEQGMMNGCLTDTYAALVQHDRTLPCRLQDHLGCVAGLPWRRWEPQVMP